MCEASAYLIEDGIETLIMESVDVLEIENGEITIVNIFGDQKHLKARIRSLSLVDHRIILEHLG